MVPPYTVHQTLTIKTLMSSQVQAQKLTFPSIQAPASTVYPALFCAKKDRSMFILRCATRGKVLARHVETV